MAELSDEIYMHRVRNGDISELAVLFERYHIRIYNLFLKLTHDTTVSQDLTQNLFQRIIKYRHSFRDDSIFKPWVYRMARNIHIDHCNERKRMDSRAVNLEQYDEYAADTNEPYGAEEFRLLDEALLKLNPDATGINYPEPLPGAEIRRYFSDQEYLGGSYKSTNAPGNKTTEGNLF